MPYRRENSSGAVLVELALVIPVLFFIVVGVINLASIIWQIQVVYEGTKFAARKSADYSLAPWPLTCHDIVEQTKSNFTSYITSYGRSMGVQMDTAWSSPTACVRESIWDTYPSQHGQIRITVNNAGASPANCILCAFDLLSYINVTVNRTFGLELGCTSPNSVACT
jgi:hypothetical protein